VTATPGLRHPHRDGAGIGIEVADPQRGQLAHPRAGRQSCLHEPPEVGIASIDKSTRVNDGEIAHPRRRHALECLNPAPSVVRADAAIAPGAGERRSQYREYAVGRCLASPMGLVV
jgi:hypothetical protein